MTTVTETRTARPFSVPALALAMAAAILVTELYAVASGSEDNPVRASFVINGIALLVAVPLFRFGVTRWSGRGAVVLGALAVLGTVAFWLGFPMVLAVAAIVVARSTAAEDGTWTTATRVAAGLGAVALVLQTAAAVL